MDSELFDHLENHEYEEALNKIIVVLAKLQREKYNEELKHELNFPDDDEGLYIRNNQYQKEAIEIEKLRIKIRLYEKLSDEIMDRLTH